MAAESKLQVVISAKDEASAVIKQFNSEVGNLGDKFTAVGGIITGALTAIGTLAVNNFSQFNSAIQRAGSYVNATSEQIKGFETAVKDAAESSSFSMNEVANALGSFVGGEISAEEASKELGDVINFATIARFSNLQSAVDVSSTALIAFQKEGLEMSQVMDSIATVAANVTTRTESYSLVLADVSSATKSAGFGFKETNILISELVGNGARLSTTGSAINSALINIRGLSDRAKESLERYGLSAKGLSKALYDGPVEMLKYLKDGFEKADESGNGFNFLVEVLGRQAAPEFAMALGATSERLDEVAGYFDDATGGAQKMLDTIKANKPPLEEIKDLYEKLSIEIGQILLPIFNAVVSKLKDAVKWFSSLDDETKKTIVYIGVFVAGLGALLTVMGMLINVFTFFTGVIGSLKLAVLSLSKASLAFLANPFVLVLTAIAVAVGFVIYKLYEFGKQVGGIKNAWILACLKMREMWDNFAIFMVNSIYTIITVLNPLLAIIGKEIKNNIITGLEEDAKNMKKQGDDLYDVLNKVTNTAVHSYNRLEKLMMGVSIAGTDSVSNLRKLMAGTQEVTNATKLSEEQISEWRYAAEEDTDAIEKAFQDIVSGIKDIRGEITDMYKDMTDANKDYLKTAGDDLIEYQKKVSDTIKSQQESLSGDEFSFTTEMIDSVAKAQKEIEDLQKKKQPASGSITQEEIDEIDKTIKEKQALIATYNSWNTGMDQQVADQKKYLMMNELEQLKYKYEQEKIAKQKQQAEELLELEKKYKEERAIKDRQFLLDEIARIIKLKAKEEEYNIAIQQIGSEQAAAVNAEIEKAKTFKEKLEEKIAGLAGWIETSVGMYKNYVAQVNATLANIAGPSLSPALNSSSTSTKGFKQFGGGISESGTYYLHRGEEIVPAGSGSKGNVTVNINGGIFNSRDAAEKIGDLIIDKLKVAMRI